MFNAIRTTIANAIAPKIIPQMIAANQGSVQASQGDLAAARSLTQTILPKEHHTLTQHSRRHEGSQITGKVSVSMLEDMNSAYLKDALASYGAWSALAYAFSEYERVTGKRTTSDEKLNQLLDEFHCWNAATSSDKQMGEEAIAVAVAKLCQTKPQQGNADTDKIIARVKGCSVDELRADRAKQAEIQAARRTQLMDGFLAAVWSFTSSDLNPSMSGAKAEAKAVQTMEFVASNWTGNPANIAAELMLMEADLAHLTKIAHLETLREGQGDYAMQTE